jgi:serine/threonine-protein kinase
MSSDVQRLHASRYRLLRTINRGGAAEVHEACVEGAGGFLRRVAIKRLLSSAREDSSLARRLMDEARLLGQLHHPNVVSVFDFGVVGDQPFLVLEWVDGDDLHGVLASAELAKRPMSAEVALYITAEVALGLQHAHVARDANGRPMAIVHRDVSPENILVSFEGEVKLTDFGIAFARRRLESTRTGVALGKLPYMAPEQLRGDEVDARADVFALGCVLHRALTGRTPFDEDRIKDRAKIDADLPEDIRAIITRATRYARSDRYPGAAEMAKDLIEALTSRSKEDPRFLLRDWLQLLGRESPSAAGPTKGDLVDVALVLGRGDEFERQDPTPTATASDGQESGGTQDPGRLDLDLAGSTIGSYQLHEVIGSGGWSRVYRASHAVLDREYAFKVMKASAASTEHALRRLRSEARLLSKIHHPNVVTVVDFGITDQGSAFLVMELVRGPTLRRVLRRTKALPPMRAVRIARQIASALAEAHGAGVIHRDLKPANIKLVEKSDPELVKILDFGIARPLDEGSAETRLTQAGLALGTPSFMSPEQIKGEPLQPASDVYALGVILYEMIAGQLPFRGTLSEIFLQHLDATPPPLPPLAGLDELVARLLAKSAADRPEATEIVRALTASLERLGVETRVTEVAQAAPAEEVALDKTPIVHPLTQRLRVERTRPITRPWRAQRLAIWASIALGVLALGIMGVAALRPDPIAIVVPADAPASSIAVPIAHRTAEETAPPEKVVAPEPLSKRPKTRTKSARMSVDDSGSQLARTLTARHVSLADLAAVPRYSAALEAWREAAKGRDPAAKQSATDGLASALLDVCDDDLVLRAKLARIHQAITFVPAGDGRSALDKRYLDVRAQMGSVLSKERCTALLVEASQLESEVDAAR